MPSKKQLTLNQIKQVAECCKANMGDLLLIVAGKADIVNITLDGLRREMGKRLNLIDPDLLCFEFVVDFPLFYNNVEEYSDNEFNGNRFGMNTRVYRQASLLSVLNRLTETEPFHDPGRDRFTVSFFSIVLKIASYDL